jgi:Rieske 2Fe-2S family protein
VTATFVRTVDSYRPGARTLPGRCYTSAAALGDEMERIFRRAWLCVGRASQWAAPGEYRLVDVAGESLIVVRDAQGVLRAHYNVCRHRGTRLCQATSGRFSETIQCAYHAWTYALDGRLLGAPHMHDVPGFAKQDHPLHAAAAAEWQGFAFVNLDPGATALARAYAPLGDRLARFRLDRLVAVRRIDYDVAANWKLILQNYSECLHCPTIHPELSRTLPYASGANDLVEGPLLGGYMQITPPNESATLSGRACGLPLGDLTDEERRRAYYYTLFPTMMLSVHPDYAVAYTVWPRGPARSLVTCEWLVHPDAPASPTYNIGDAEEFWDRTNRQDWHICELSQQGVASRMYAPGFYSPRESIPAAWDREYLRAMGQHPAH